MAGRKGPGRALTVDPARLILDDFLAGDVVANEINQLSSHSGKHFLKSLQHDRIDQQMVHRREVRPKGHVIQVIVRLGRT